MLFAILGLAMGLAIGFYIPNIFISGMSFYISVAVLAVLDSLFGAVKANMIDEFDSLIFITGFIFNAILAGLLAFIGDKMGIPLYYAAIFTFGGRIFQNSAIIRRLLISRFREKKKKNI